MSKTRNIAILGSTGSIGRNALDVLSTMAERYAVRYLTAHGNIDLLRVQINKFRPRGVVVRDEEQAAELRRSFNGSVEVLWGTDGLMEIAGRDDTDILLSALVGFAGLQPTLRAIEARKDIALANKETLVVGGEIVMNAVAANGVRLLPVDSEHSAILQCLQGERMHEVHRLILTASGGPFLHRDSTDLETITVSEALKHPTWKMGNKITIDSATLMNKGLEVIEARWLFDVPAEKIDVVIHPQSIIHSMVEFADGSMKAQMGMPDMKLPIQYALTYPERPAMQCNRIDFGSLHQLTFQTPDTGKFRCLPLAFRALSMGGTATAVLNAANEIAVGLFLENRIGFTAIADLIEEALDTHTPVQHPTLDDVLRADSETRTQVLRHVHIAQ